MTPTAVQYGVGPIGARVAALAAERGYEFVGAVDVDPAKVGADLGDLLDGNLLDRDLRDGDHGLGATVTDDPAAALADDPDVVFHSTVSSLGAARPQLEAALAAGADVVSTCEELAYPWRHGADAEAIDDAAREAGATCLGTGINPGFAMDVLPAVLTAPCRRVDAVRVERVQDAGERRRPLQEKVGAGTSEADFRERVAEGGGHVGGPESAALLAAALDWELSGVDERVEPVLADAPVETDHVDVAAGEVAGVRQVVRGSVDGEVRIELDLSMYVGAEAPRDRVVIEGEPDVDCAVDGGLHGDVTTPAVVVNAAPRVRAADPGLATMLDLPVPACGGR